MTQHIGIIGCSAEGAALCYKTICTEAPKIMGGYNHPEVTMHTPSLSRYVEHLNKGNIDGVASLMLESSRVLEQSGADFLICPDNTIHQAYERVVAETSLPFLHIADVVAEEAINRGFKTLGLTGTEWLVRSEVYPEILTRKGLSYHRPDTEQISRIGDIIMSELVHGLIKDSSVNYFETVIEQLKSKGCDAVILGCTEIPLIVNDSNSSLPTLDSTRLLAKAAISRAIEK